VRDEIDDLMLDVSQCSLGTPEYPRDRHSPQKQRGRNVLLVDSGDSEFPNWDILS